MPRRFVTAINLSQNELQNARIQNLPTPPSSPVVGQVYFDTALGFERIWDGTNWQRDSFLNDPYLRSNHMGTQTASTISDLTAAIQAVPFNSLATATGNVNVGNFRLTSVADPQSSQDTATKNYVDNVVSGKDYKDSVQAATTTALPSNSRSGNVLTASSNGALGPIDGVTLKVNDRLLVKDEATQAKIGLYSITSLGSVGTPWILTRTLDADNLDANNAAISEVTQGLTVVVDAGTVNGGTQYTLTTPDPITLNTTALTFAKTVGAGGITYSAGNGLGLSGTTFSVVPGNGIVADGSSTRIDTAVVPRMYVTTLVGDGSTTSFPITHNLNNQWPWVQTYNTTTGSREEANVVGTNANVCTVNFDVAPSAVSYRVNLLG